METIAQRIKLLRKTLNLTQQKLAERLSVKRNTVGQWEIGRNIPTDTAISLMCKEFNVNEEWLRTGNGNIFLSDAHSLDKLIPQTPAEELNLFKTQFISMLVNLSTDEWELLKKIAEQLPLYKNEQYTPVDMNKKNIG